MSEVNPFTGQSSESQAEPEVQKVPNPRVSFEDPSLEKLNELMRSDEAEEYQRIADAASRTSFATGDRVTDIRSYLKFRGSINNLLGLLEGNDGRRR